MNTLREALDRRGLTPAKAARMGVPYQNIIKQYKGLRGIGPQSALLYEEVLGIPRHELRPDLWSAPAPANKEDDS